MGCTQKAFDYRNRYDEDGMMIGRAVIGYPWIFGEIKHFFATGELLAPPQYPSEWKLFANITEGVKA